MLLIIGYRIERLVSHGEDHICIFFLQMFLRCVSWSSPTNVLRDVFIATKSTVKFWLWTGWGFFYWMHNWKRTIWHYTCPGTKTVWERLYSSVSMLLYNVADGLARVTKLVCFWKDLFMVLPSEYLSAIFKPAKGSLDNWKPVVIFVFRMNITWFDLFDWFSAVQSFWSWLK